MNYSYSLLLIFYFFFNCNLQAQTNYFVSTYGSDANNGTSIATAWKTIQKAANSAIPNSIVNILEGTYNELVTINVSGTTGNPIVFRNFQDDSVILSGAGFSTDYSNLIAIASKSNIVIDGLILENLTAKDARGILVLSNIGSGSENITFKNLIVRNIGFTTNPDTLPVMGNNAHGILIYGQGIDDSDAIKNIIIENCEVYDLITGYSEAITINGNVDGFSILNNSVHDNTNIGIDIAGNFGASGNPSLDHARNGIISRNTTFNNVSPIAISAGIYCDGCHNTIIERNISYHNPLGISIGCEENGNTDSVTVRNNIVFKNSYTGISVGGYTSLTTGIVENSIVNNNTCYKNDVENLHGQMVITKTNNCGFFHNIFYSNGSLLFYVDNISPQNFYSDNNLFYTTTGDSALAMVNYQWNTIEYTAYKSNTSQELQSVFVQPLFIDTNASSLNLHLLSSSPAINSGNPSYIPSLSEKDIDGEIRANDIVDIGADEYYSYLDTHIACDSFLWIDGNVYIESNNTAIFTLMNTAGFDSIVTLNLTMHNTVEGVDEQEACYSYEWIDGNIYTESNNTATHTIAGGSSHGCDSIVTLNLTINTVDTSVIVNETTLTANLAGVSYQWLNCDDNFAIMSGETSQFFTATENGNYAVEITQNGCVDTSACFAITSVGIVENDFGNNLVVYPNPTNRNIVVDLGASYASISAKIFDVNGKFISTNEFENSRQLNFVFEGTSGYYLLEIVANKKIKATIKVLKE